MPLSSLVLTENHLSRSGVFNAATQARPYNRLYFNLPGSLVGNKIALQKLNLYYSWPNISNNNNTFSISWPTSTATYTNVNVTIPNNYNLASVDELNAYLQTIMIANKMYVYETANPTNFLYYMQFISNPNTYGISLILNLVPTTLPSGYTAPAGFIGWPTVSRTMKFTTDASKFNLLIGYAASSIFDGNTSATTYVSSFTPSFSPVNTILLRCSHSNNPMALNNDSNVIYSFTTRGTAYGSLIEIEPQNLVYYTIATTSNVLIIDFVDQDYTGLQILDYGISILLLVNDE